MIMIHVVNNLLSHPEIIDKVALAHGILLIGGCLISECKYQL
jgi:hypothetical protein